MADTALNKEEIKEFYDSPEQLQAKIKTLARFVRASKHFSVYTGAGISTAAGVPDFRGPNGCWTRAAKVKRGEKVPVHAGRSEYMDRKLNTGRITVRPTLSHMAIVGMMKAGLCKFLISSNCDGLHLASGVPPNMISEVHGNGNVEFCSICGTSYHRGFAKVRTGRNRALVTGRACPKQYCKGVLRYTTVAFEQSMPDVALARAEQEAQASDLVLTLGTSMRVFPSCDLPLEGRRRHGKKHKLVLVNLQKTPYDDECALRIFAKVDDVCSALMAELKLDIPQWGGADVIENDEWLRHFTASWPFRSKGDKDWFKGPHIVKFDAESLEAHDWDLALRQATGNDQYARMHSHINKFRENKSHCKSLAQIFSRYIGGGSADIKRLAPGLVGLFLDQPDHHTSLKEALKAEYRQARSLEAQYEPNNTNDTKLTSDPKTRPAPSSAATAAIMTKDMERQNQPVQEEKHTENQIERGPSDPV